MNIDLAIRVRTNIVTNPEGHNQSSWGKRVTDSSGVTVTTMCAAGITCVEAGAELVWEPGTYADFLNYVATMSLPEHAQSLISRTYVPSAAQALLDIDDSKAADLFFRARTTQRVVELLDRWIADEVVGV